MKRKVLAALWFAMACASASAGDSSPYAVWPSWFQCRPLCPPIGSCCDDYVRKPCPAIQPVPRCGGPDDYCRKPMPCVEPVSHCGGPDDYCRKHFPCLLCPPSSPWLRCGPADGHGCIK